MLKLVAAGQMTDYDGLAIALGRAFRERWIPSQQWLGGSLQDYHTEGSRILEELRRQKIIRINSRGVNRRAVKDLDTGRESGDFKDTVSREVQILNPAMLELQDRNRRLELATRFGSDRPENKLYIVPGKKTYVNAVGENTGISVITRSASANFDAKTIDGDIARVLNHTASTEFVTDNDFATFYERLLHYRDNRGNAKYYDELNGFRKEVLKRGDQGFGMMAQLKYYNTTERSPTIPYGIRSFGYRFEPRYIFRAGRLDQ